VASSNVTTVTVVCVDNATLSGSWTWRGGSKFADPAGTYGTLGTAAAANTPGGRNWSGSWTDGAGRFWLFGGFGIDSTGAMGDLNDLWRYDPVARLWTWIAGPKLGGGAATYGTRGVAAATNIPGAREYPSTWTDASGNLWMFGGGLYDPIFGTSPYNDLWKYDPAAGMWTWVAGASTASTPGNYGTRGVAAAGNAPGARYVAMSWSDANGDLWLFGGMGIDATGNHDLLNDLWKFTPSTGLWTWMGGSTDVASPTNGFGVYGTRGVAAAGNAPGARYAGQTWVDAGGILWLFGGYGQAAVGGQDYLSDLWSYSPGTGQWTWVGGANTLATPGVYGTKGTAAAANTPGARGGAVVWVDASGKLSMFGGFGFDAVGTASDDLNDLWQYNPTTGQWVWINGSNTVGAGSVYGTMNVSATTTQPGSRDSGSAWVAANGHIWIFGGVGVDSVAVRPSGGLNELFEYTP
jgi:N-acetylneuraminic acid mutarotase